MRVRVVEPLRVGGGEQLVPGDFQEVEAHAFGYVWTDCTRVNDEALSELAAKGKEAGYDVVAAVEWFDMEREAWSETPRCHTQYAWIFGLFYTFWWYEATTVRVRGKATKRAALRAAVGPRELFPDSKSGERAPTTSDQRAATRSLVLTSAFTMIPPYGEIAAETWRRRARARRFVLSGGTLTFGSRRAGSNLTSSVGLGVDEVRYFGNSFNVALGLALVERTYSIVEEYEREGEYQRRDDGAETRVAGTRKEWSAAGRAAIANEWRVGRIVFGMDWAGVEVPFAILRIRGYENHERAASRIVLPRLMVSRFGWTF